MKKHTSHKLITIALAIITLMIAVNGGMVSVPQAEATGEKVTGYQLPWLYGTVWPVTGSPQFHTERSGYERHAVDFGLNKGTKVFAMRSGEIVVSHHLEKYGGEVVIDHKNGYCSVYLHLSKLQFSIAPGQTPIPVRQGQEIGLSGALGKVVHLHVAVFKKTSKGCAVSYAFSTEALHNEAAIIFDEVSRELTREDANKQLRLTSQNVLSRPPSPAPARWVVSSPLVLSNLHPYTSQSITAEFKVKNPGGQPIILEELAAGARRGSDWSGEWADFPHVSITLQPNQEYTYRQSRSFSIAGNYFAEPVVKVAGQWGGMEGANRVQFAVAWPTPQPPPTPPPPTPTPSPWIQFIGNPSSRLFFDNNNDRINLTICADNLPGKTVYVVMNRSAVAGNPPREWRLPPQVATSRCVTFYDMDGAGPTFTGIDYYTKAALNARPDPNWPTPCYTATGGYGLCDRARR